MPPKKKTIQDIKPTRKSLSVRKKRAVLKERAVEKVLHEPEAPVQDLVKRRSSSRKKKSKAKKGSTPKMLWVALAAVVIFFLFLLSTVFSGAVVTLTPENIVLPDSTISLKAIKNATSGLSFQTISVSGDRQVFAESDTVESVERVATGRVTLFNNHSGSSQRLLIDTRLEAPNGKIYKTKKAVVIPGRKEVDGEIIPGSISVDVYAEAPGEEYNVGLTDFVIYGFKGTSKEKTFYGRSDTLIEGGVIGSLYTLSEDVVSLKTEEVSSLLQHDLKTKLEAQIPENFILLEGSEEYQKNKSSEYFESVTPRIEISESGKLSAVIIDVENLASAIAEKSISTYQNSAEVLIGNVPALIIKNSDPAVGIDGIKQISFSVSGKPHIIWSIDSDRIRYDLVNTRKKQFNSIMSRYEYVEEAKLSVQPFWQGSLPESIDNIKIINTVLK